MSMVEEKVTVKENEAQSEAPAKSEQQEEKAKAPKKMVKKVKKKEETGDLKKEGEIKEAPQKVQKDHPKPPKEEKPQGAPKKVKEEKPKDEIKKTPAKPKEEKPLLKKKEEDKVDLKEKEKKKEKEEEEEEEIEIVEEEEGYKVKIKPKLSKEQKHNLRIRSSIKTKTPHFRRQEWFRYKRLGTAWRKPQGLHSKLRKHMGYRQNVVSIGYGTPSESRHLHPSGFQEVLVFNINDLEKIDPKHQAARIGHGVGTRKRIEIEKSAEKKGIRVLNPRRF